MCGILAYFNRNGIKHEQLSNSLSALKKINHRGPDGEGLVLINSKTGEFYNVITNETPKGNFKNTISPDEAANLNFDLLFGHRRLSIIDLSINGHQPMYDDNGNWIVFNGEIYNYIELRNELKKSNCTFKTESDTEVILKAYQIWGVNCVKKFNGMFSIVLFDKAKQQLFVVNDRYGVKPLYSYINSNELILSSEIRQIKEYKPQLTYNSNSITNFVSHMYLDNTNDTFYNEIQRYPCAHFSEFKLHEKNNIIQSEAYYKLEDTVINYSNPVEEFKHLLTDAVKIRLRSDVPVGFASSGGLDSSSILYVAYNLLKASNPDPNVETFSAIFPGTPGDESKYIKIVEEHLKIKSNYTNPLNEFNLNDLEDLIDHQEVPIQSMSFYAEWCVSRMVKKENVKVLLIGQGGDEILAGYHHHFYRYCRQLIMQGKILKYLSLIKKYAEIKGFKVNDLHKRILNEVKLSLKFKLGLQTLGTVLNTKWNKADKLIDLLKMDMLEFTLPTYLRSGDRSSMAFSIEARHPFLDYRLVDFCYSLPDDKKIKDGWQKWILREAMPEMPDSIRMRKDKIGFTAPEALWIEKYKNEFESYLKYLPVEFKTIKYSNPFLYYSLGIWFKTLSKETNAI